MRLSLIMIASLLIGAAGLAADLTDGLIAHFPFSGTAGDASGNNHHGTVYGPVLTTDRLGNPGAAYLFDGIDDYILVEDAIPLRLANTDFSLSVWAYETQRNDSFQDALLVKRGSLAQDGWFFSITGLHPFNPYGAGRVYYQVSGGADPRMYSPETIPLNAWAHLVVNYSLTEHNARIYIDGSLAVVSAYLPTPNPDTAIDLFIGRDSEVAGYHWHGKIDDVRIYNRQLSLDEIQVLAGVLGDLTAPEALSIARADGQVHLNWNPVPSATSYSVFSSSDPSLPHANWNLVASGLQNPQWSTPEAEKMFFFVRAYR